jgi:catechol 2,3-dioxygenase-like lactoylglutathione lyase family enzyme
MVTGAHAIIYSKDADADRAFFRDVLGFPSTDAGGGWLIFALPPSEVAVHPTDGAGGHELYLMCDDIAGLVRALGRKRVACSPVHEERWGALVHLTLPSGGRLGIYEPRHPRPPRTVRRGSSRKKAAGARSRRRPA